MGSVPYGLPCLAVTRRTGNSSQIIQSTSIVNNKLCNIFRAPGDYVDFESEDEVEESESEEEGEGSDVDE